MQNSGPEALGGVISALDEAVVKLGMDYTVDGAKPGSRLPHDRAQFTAVRNIGRYRQSLTAARFTPLDFCDLAARSIVTYESRPAPSYHSSPSYNGGGGSYRGSSGGSYGGSRTYDSRPSPSYHSSPSYNGGGGYRQSPSSGGAGSYHGGGGNQGDSSTHSSGGGSKPKDMHR